MKKKLHYSIIIMWGISIIALLKYQLSRFQASNTGYQMYGLIDSVYYWVVLIVCMLSLYVIISAIVFHYNCMIRNNNRYAKLIITIEGIWTAFVAMYVFILVLFPIFMLSYYDTKTVYKGKTYVVRVHFWLDHSFDYYSEYTNTLIPMEPDFHAIMHDEYEDDYRNHLGNEKALIILDY